MQLKTFTLPVFLLVTSFAFSQADPFCTGSGRYVDSLFACVEKTENIQYGTGVKNWGFGNLFCLDLTLPPYNTQLPLRCDVYEPCDDTLSARPLIVAIHGGAWAAGDKSEFASFAEIMAKKGYVVASINYRLSIPVNPLCWNGEVDSIKFYRAAIRGIQDSKAAVRYFRANAAEYRIHPDYIFAIGGSAGGFNALGVGYMNGDYELPGAAGAQPQYGSWGGNLLLPDMGGVEGNGGNPGVSSHVRAVVSLSGAVTDTLLFEGPDDPALLAFHGDADDVVPYGYDCALKSIINIGLFNKCIRVFGPEAYLPYAQSIGVNASLTTFPGGGHAFTGEEVETIVSETTVFLCEQMPPLNVSAVETLPVQPWAIVAPNPASGSAQLRSSPDMAGKTWQLHDLHGRLIMQTFISGEAQPLNLSQVPSGLYIWNIRGGTGGPSGKVIIE
jgi:dienelactone hydrolase